MGQKQKTEEKEEEEERLNDGDNNGQATHGARRQAWRTQAGMAHASRLGQFKPLNCFVRLPLEIWDTHWSVL